MIMYIQHDELKTPDFRIYWIDYCTRHILWWCYLMPVTHWSRQGHVTVLTNENPAITSSYTKNNHTIIYPLELHGFGFSDLDLDTFKKGNPNPSPNPWNILNPKSNPIQGQNEIQVQIQIRSTFKSKSMSKSMKYFETKIQSNPRTKWNPSPNRNLKYL